MKLEKVLNELSLDSWNESHLHDLVLRSKSLSPSYFMDRYGDDLKTMPRKFVKPFIDSIKDEDLLVKLSDYKKFREHIKIG